MSHLLLPQPWAALPGVGVTGYQHWHNLESVCTEYHTDIVSGPNAACSSQVRNAVARTEDGHQIWWHRLDNFKCSFKLSLVHI